jgi:glucose/mannose-6-phosphate isomerase
MGSVKKLMLDDLKYIHQRDAQDALGIAEKQWQQLQHRFQVSLAPRQLKNVVLSGMGGSALPGVFITSWPGLKVPFEIVRDYQIPGYVNSETLFIASSYSGNTEETLAALAEAEKSQAQIVVVSAGGKLTEHAHEKKYPLFEVPSGIQPRMSAFYFLAAFIQIFEACGLVENKLPELQSTAAWLNEQVLNWRPDVASNKNLAKQVAMELAGKTVIVYSGPLLFPAANKWKIGMNENAKNLAWSNQYPEFNHNEFIGWSSHPIEKAFGVVEIRSDLEHPRVQKRFAVSERLLSGKRPSPIVIQPQGDSVLKQLLWASSLGDFVSIYLALLNNVNPTPVDLVERFKSELNS